MATTKNKSKNKIDRPYVYNPEMEKYIQEGLEREYPELKGHIYVYVEVGEDGRTIWKCAGRGGKPKTSASDEEILARFKALANEAVEKFGIMVEDARMKHLLLKRKEAVNFAIFFQRSQETITERDKEIIMKAAMEHDKKKKRPILINGLNEVVTEQLAHYNKAHKCNVKLTREERRMIVASFLPDYEEGARIAEEEVDKFISMSPQQREEYLANACESEGDR